MHVSGSVGPEKATLQWPLVIMASIILKMWVFKNNFLLICRYFESSLYDQETSLKH